MNKPRLPPQILLIGPLPPPYGGQSILTENILHCNLANEFGIRIINISHFTTNKIFRLFISLKFMIKILTVLFNEHSIKILHIQTSAGFSFYEKSIFSLIGKIFRKKIILHIHGGKFIEFWNLANFFEKMLIKNFLELNNTVIVLNKTWETFYKNKIKCTNNIITLPNAIKCNNYIKNYKDSNEIILLYVGHLKPEKGLLDLLNSLKILSSNILDRVTLHIVGEGDTSYNEEMIKNEYSKFSGNVCFLGPLSGKNKWNEFEDATIFVLPSHTEDMPITILEAMSYGLPVVATSVGSITEIIEDGVNGFIVPPRDFEALAKKLSLLMSNVTLRESFGCINKKKANQIFSFVCYEKKLSEIYNHVMDN